ncbi:MAG: hypothetical protein J6D20_02385 [Clostridia bacterium]|nr:hypothetical protein [Clostridia bacterium]
MKRIVCFFAMLLSLVAMAAFSFCVFFHYNVLGYATAVGDAIGSALLLPVAIVAFFAAAFLAFICWIASLGAIQGKKIWAIIPMILLVVEAIYVGYILLSISA